MHILVMHILVMQILVMQILVMQILNAINMIIMTCGQLVFFVILTHNVSQKRRVIDMMSDIIQYSNM